MSAPDSLEPLWLLISDSRHAIDEEIEAVLDGLARRGLDAPIPALSGRARDESASGYRYAFQIPGGRYDIRVEDRVRIRSGGREALGRVLRFDRGLGLVQVLVPEWLGERLQGTELEFDPTWLLRELSDRLLEIAEEPDAFHPGTVLGIFGRRPPRLGRTAPVLPTSEDLNPPQRDALERLLGSDAQLVWGPPGTGKSRLVARAALELAERGRVLVVATTNGAVDEIVGRLAKLAPPELLEAGRVVRVGSDLGESSPLALDTLVERRLRAGAGGVTRVLDEVAARLGRPAAADGAEAATGARLGRLLAVARARDDGDAARALGRARLEIGREAERALEEATIVLTTFARLSVREELRSLRYDALLVDEASTAPLPYVAYAAALAGGRAVAVGDFQQLPPVVASDGPAAARWLRRDLFQEAGVVSPGGRDGPELPAPHDGLCAMLDVQYRMMPDIRSLVSEFFYAGRLTDAEEIGLGSREAPFDPAVLLIDTSELAPSVERVDGSRRNPRHAEVVGAFLAEMARDGRSDIAVVSPYRAQTRHLRDVARRGLGRAAPAGLEISTIHRFQGREKRVVVIDTVDAPPGRSWFLDERRNPDFPRLLNVALSRARDGLVLVASLEGLRRTLPHDALLHRLLERVATGWGRVSARVWVPGPGPGRGGGRSKRPRYPADDLS